MVSTALCDQESSVKEVNSAVTGDGGAVPGPVLPYPPESGPPDDMPWISRYADFKCRPRIS